MHSIGCEVYHSDVKNARQGKQLLVYHLLNTKIFDQVVYIPLEALRWGGGGGGGGRGGG